MLTAYRGYPAGDVFTGMPADVAWHHAALTPAELATVRYLDYPYWTDFSGGTRLAADGARRLGPGQDQSPGTIYRQIAENLNLSERTVENHVLHILTKLDVPSRTAAAGYAIRNGLA